MIKKYTFVCSLLLAVISHSYGGELFLNVAGLRGMNVNKGQLMHATTQFVYQNIFKDGSKAEKLLSSLCEKENVYIKFKLNSSCGQLVSGEADYGRREITILVSELATGPFFDVVMQLSSGVSSSSSNSQNKQFLAVWNHLKSSVKDFLIHAVVFELGNIANSANLSNAFNVNPKERDKVSPFEHAFLEEVSEHKTLAIAHPAIEELLPQGGYNKVDLSVPSVKKYLVGTMKGGLSRQTPSHFRTYETKQFIFKAEYKFTRITEVFESLKKASNKLKQDDVASLAKRLTREVVELEALMVMIEDLPDQRPDVMVFFGRKVKLRAMKAELENLAGSGAVDDSSSEQSEKKINTRDSMKQEVNDKYRTQLAIRELNAKLVEHNRVAHSIQAMTNDLGIIKELYARQNKNEENAKDDMIRHYKAQYAKFLGKIQNLPLIQENNKNLELAHDTLTKALHNSIEAAKKAVDYHSTEIAAYRETLKTYLKMYGKDKNKIAFISVVQKSLTRISAALSNAGHDK